MDLIASFLDLVVHLDQHLRALAQNYGNWIYAVLFLIVFLETGLVVTPFLPGDSLLFVAGTIAAGGELQVHGLVALLILAAIIGDSVNYAVGRYLGPRVFRFEDSRFFKRAYLERTHAFFERHGGKTIIIARFVPIIRTYAPFVAGIGAMKY
ncbi:MAG TPA: VTT domain-containing protein, partial [Burkholderiales bacterium]|nr:VTT domain-containing protein [Burkholderiales bacterium]